MAELYDIMYLGDSKIKHFALGGTLVAPNPYYFDSDALAFLEAAQITDSTTVFAVNNLVIDLKEATLWDKFIAIYPFVGGTAFTQKWNLKNPQDTNEAYRLTFSGGITHSLDGIQGNGTDGFYNTHISGSVLSQNDTSMFIYSRTNVAEAKADMGYLQNSTSPFPGLQIVARSNVNTLQNRCNSSNPAGASNTPNTNSIGVIGVYRNNSSNFIDFINKAETTVAKASVAPDPSRIYGLCFNLNGSAGFFSTKQQALAGVGSALSTSLLSDLVDINQTFQTALGRFV